MGQSELLLHGGGEQRSAKESLDCGKGYLATAVFKMLMSNLGLWLRNIESVDTSDNSHFVLHREHYEVLYRRWSFIVDR